MMTVNELRDWLNTQPGDAIVLVYADHGQSRMKATTTSECKIPKAALASFMIDAEDEADEEPEREYVRCVEIGAP